ncbi:MAG: carbohydrate kinase family protein [Candidatus Bathyarchaeia archaeon]
MRIIVVGHVSMDKVITSKGENRQPGGAALYTAVAAKTLIRNVNLVTCVGRDYAYMDVLRDFDLKGIKISSRPSTSFTIRYDEDWKAEYLEVKIGAGVYIKHSQIPVDWLGDETVLHLAPMPPQKVFRMIDFIRKSGPKTLISVNTWIGYIRKSTLNTLKEIARKADFFVLNEAEARALTGLKSLPRAVAKLEAKTLLVTLGELGAIVKRGDDITLIPALAKLPGETIDVTGAGDVWCGGFISGYVLTKDLNKAVVSGSILAGLKCQDWYFRALLRLRFNSVESLIRHIISLRGDTRQRKITSYVS